MSGLFDARLAMQSLSVGAGLAMALTSAESLSRFAPYARTGLLTWELGRLIPPAPTVPGLQRLGDWLYTDARFRALLGLRVLLGLGMGICGVLAVFPPALYALALLTSGLVLFRSSVGHEGSFQLRLVMLTVLLTCSLSPWASPAFDLGLGFLSAQVGLSYFLAGIAKLRGPTWRDGTGLVGLFGTRYHGHPRVHALLAPRPRLARAVSWSIIGFELCFPLVLLGDDRVLVAMLTLTACFHLAIAVLMGLNAFLVSFLATYPALFYTLRQ